MTLRPEIVTPPHRFFTTLIAAGIGLGVAGGVVAIAAATQPVAPASVPSLPLPAITADEPVEMHVATVAQAPQAPLSSEFLFVFRAGGSTYVQLENLGTRSERTTDDDGNNTTTTVLPRHGKVKLHDDEGVTAAIAPVADGDVAAVYRALRDHELRVDGKCTARVIGFALVSRLTGDPGYAGIESGNWTAATALEQGAAVLAAQITGCKDGVYARDAALPPVVTLETVKDADLARAARSALLASDVARATQTAWTENQGEGKWYDHVEFDTRVLRHPTTGVTWVGIHAHFWEGCGGPEANVWGLFRAGKDGVETVDVRKLEQVHAIEQILDVDGDGDLEIVGRPWIGLGRLLVDADDERVIDSLEIPFYGCPC